MGYGKKRAEENTKRGENERVRKRNATRTEIGDSDLIECDRRNQQCPSGCVLNLDLPRSKTLIGKYLSAPRRIRIGIRSGEKIGQERKGGEVFDEELAGTRKAQTPSNDERCGARGKIPPELKLQSPRIRHGVAKSRAGIKTPSRPQRTAGRGR
ncbi:hypothetical protein DBV15_03065 [Temnothorax longispinosus]|uniref:Uncharacterized protein n=1 Tax=Temnothorax longispinosus TaxID=300112 RepID=A0A4S2KIH8_9HYME|nr:hypothetical protein DBV15_03065 [Temnothorax longispinosus]